MRIGALRPMASPDKAVEHLVESGDLIRVRRGWYALPGAEEPVVRAVAAGGVMGCVSALAHRGVWVPPHVGIHVRAARGGVALGPTITRCNPARRLPAPSLSVDPVPIALRTAAGCMGPDDLLAIVDSCLDQRLIDGDELPMILRGTPGRGARRVKQTDWAQSGTETYIRVRLRRRHLTVTTQVKIAGVGRVDMVVGDCLVVEADSSAHHAGPDAYRRDRARDLALARLGYRCLRLTWEQVMYEWDAVEATIMALVADGAHRRPAGRHPGRPKE